MIITRRILELIDRSVPREHTEAGGILGSRNGEKVDSVVFDIPDCEVPMGCVYSPDVDYLNDRIKQWQHEGIRFMGMFHTHFHGVRTLSCGDKRYIHAIMNAMPVEINRLYFPVYVLPERELVCYIATRSCENVEIRQEMLYVKK